MDNEYFTGLLSAFIKKTIIFPTMNKKDVTTIAVQVGKREYTRPEASVESYNVERGFAASGAFEGLSESGNSYGNGNFT